MSSSNHERIEKDDGFSKEDRASIVHQRRVWQVRKYSQVKPSSAHFDDGTVSFREENETADPALTALLRGLRNQLNADIVMISLLDDHQQIFLAGATGDNSNDAQISSQSAQWYGCDQVSHHGGLCERTITINHQPGTPALYEVLDMAETERTQNLPFVCGTIAEFRHYVGMPITSPDGLNIGTVFAMSEAPATHGINRTQLEFFYSTTRHVMRQLVQAVQALDGRRAERYNEALSALLNGRAHKHLQRHGTHLPTYEEPTQVENVYRASGELLYDCLDLSGLVFQTMSLTSQHSRNPSDERQDTIITSKLGPGVPNVVPLNARAVHKLLEAFPRGGVLHVDDVGERRIFAGASSQDATVLDAATNASLNRSFAGARQIIFTPLWDAVHNRNTALCVGWVLDDERVFQPETDLNAMSSFCMATISLVLRIESQMMEQVKSDFLGSISHETRSPLHNVLGNLELALETDCSPQLREMITTARFGATQLLDTLDKILLHSGVRGQSAAALISQSSPLSDDKSAQDQDKTKDRERLVMIGQGSGEGNIEPGDTSLMDLCENIVEDVARRMRLSDTMMSPAVERKGNRDDQDGFPYDQQNDSENGQDDEFSIITFDSRSSDNRMVSCHDNLRIILDNLLSNAIKFTRSGYCVQISLRWTDDHCCFNIVDCGRGFSKDFINHNLFVPFSQQMPLDNGVGLGLSLVKRNVELLEGTLQFETDETLGSTVAVSLPVPKLTAGVEQKAENDCNSWGGTALIPPMRRQDESKLPVLKASVYAPKWLDDERGERSIRLLHDSIAHTLETWFQPRITLWHQTESYNQGQDEELPQIVFIAQSNLASFQKFSGHAFAGVRKIVVCADLGEDSELDAHNISAASQAADAIITGSILPSKLWKVMTHFFPHIQPNWDASRERNHSRDDSHGRVDGDLQAVTDDNGSQRSSSADGVNNDHEHEEPSIKSPEDQAQSMHHAHQGSTNAGNPESAPSEMVLLQSRPVQHYHEGGEISATMANHGANAGHQVSYAQNAPEANSQDVTYTVEDPGQTGPKDTDASAKTGDSEAAVKPSVQPKLLLVDDNNINLKMLVMFVKKCVIAKDNLVQASGGRQAIDMYAEAKAAAAGEDKPPASFDIIFMDLSMPDISGFDAISAIRRMEASTTNGKRSYIVALTGLTSDKDRQAAMLAGADEYITKPAGLQNVRDVIDKWNAEPK